MSRPVVGICTALEQVRWRVWDQQAYLLPRGYVDAIQGAGGLALMLAPDERLVSDPDEALDLVDALVLAGGADIDPACYGTPPHPATSGCNLERDRFEVALARRALARDTPLLGICRGMQLINVACGGTLLQHLPESHGHHEHRRTPGSFEDADHDVRLLEGSLARHVAGEAVHATKSHHHQGVDRLGEGLVVTGWSTLDDLPEAIESPGRRFALGVQWHPEADERSRVVAALVEEARSRRAAQPERDGAGRRSRDGGRSGAGGAAAPPARGASRSR